MYIGSYACTISRRSKVPNNEYLARSISLISCMEIQSPHHTAWYLDPQEYRYLDRNFPMRANQKRSFELPRLDYTGLLILLHERCKATIEVHV